MALSLMLSTPFVFGVAVYQEGHCQDEQGRMAFNDIHVDMGCEELQCLSTTPAGQNLSLFLDKVKTCQTRTLAGLPAANREHHLNLKGSNLSGVIFENMNLEGADFEGANLSNAVFVGGPRGKYDQMNFSYANLSHAEFHGTNLDSTSFMFALMEGTDLRQAQLHRTTLIGVENAGILFPAEGSDGRDPLRFIRFNMGQVCKEFKHARENTFLGHRYALEAFRREYHTPLMINGPECDFFELLEQRRILINEMAIQGHSLKNELSLLGEAPTLEDVSEVESVSIKNMRDYSMALISGGLFPFLLKLGEVSAPNFLSLKNYKRRQRDMSVIFN